MPDTQPHQPDPIRGDRAVADDTIAVAGGNSAARTRIQTIGSEGERTASGAEPPTIILRLTILVIVTILPSLAFSTFIIMRYAHDQRIQYRTTTHGNNSRHITGH